MPLPFILGAGAAIAGAVGIGNGVSGAKKMKNAKDDMESIQNRHERNNKKFESKNKSTNKVMDSLGELELNILNGFKDFSDVIEKIQNRPEFKEIDIDGVTIPKYDEEELKNVSVGAGVLLGGLGGAAAGTAGGFAAAGAATSAVMALGTASTGTAIASLSGAAATNATLAALGGGAIAAGGGGIALGTTILGAATLGVGLLVGGVIFNCTGSKLSDKVDQARSEMKKAEDTINKICSYLDELSSVAKNYINALTEVKEKYSENFNYISYTVNNIGKTDWNEFSKEEQLALENTVLLVGLLYNMCKVRIVEKSADEDELNTINKNDIQDEITKSKEVLSKI